MSHDALITSPGHAQPEVFPETRWTLVLRAAGQGATGAGALADLCRDYWRPIYAVARGSGLSREDAEDVTQNFFADLISTNSLDRVSPEAGRLRWFLLTTLRRQMNHLRARACAAKRGGGVAPLPLLDMAGAEDYYGLIPADHVSPDVLYDRHWTLALMDRAMSILADEQAGRGRRDFFSLVRPTLTGEGADLRYADIAVRHSMTEAAVKTSVVRLRQRLREILRAEIAGTVTAPADVDDEIRHLFASFS